VFVLKYNKNRSSKPLARTDGDRFCPATGKKYLAFNKPYAVLCQFTAANGDAKKTLASFEFPKDVYPVGRLDYDSEGLLILTDDSRLNNALLNPKLGHSRTYYVQVENIPSSDKLAQLEAGLVIEGRLTQPAVASIIDGEPGLPPRAVPIRQRKHIPTAWLKLTLTEGRNRQIRKMTAAIGCPTLRLVRIAIGELALSDLDLQPGKWQPISDRQLKLLFD
jgi:23S rRNA pseudouridine2457 synthase